MWFCRMVSQIGSALVLIPAVVWMYYAGDALWATVLLGFCLVAMTKDNFLRPVLIRKDAHLPLLLILAGVIGGLLSMGPLGIFLGPTVLAIGCTWLNAWMAEGDEAEPPVAAA
jgi:predicted PurR-regulated permease PerM